MEATKILPSSLIPRASTLLPRKPSQFYSRHCRPLGATENETNNTESTLEAEAGQPPAAPPSTLNIRRLSRRQARRLQMEQQENVNKAPAPPPPRKDWKSMTLGEKAVELYVGEKGLLFWLNKFAYASIFVVIGGWILFRFVGPSLGLYQLDAPPLPPSSIFKG